MGLRAASPAGRKAGMHVEPFDARQVQGNLLVARDMDGAQPPIQFGRGRDQPLAGRRKDE